MTNYKTQAETSAEMRSCPRFVQVWKKALPNLNTPGAKKSKILIRRRTGVQPILGSFELLRVRVIWSGHGIPVIKEK